ncbi:MAG TPA: hypothetical protein PJ983_02225 [Flavobacteriales bacterium]|nr:hypothetical protein [Flavobacteriales bacterium]HNA31805.1 hypothetical protein [Flavobacteriales bacterium]HNE80143.1 hypothetical protein [Flavobacteriales bacterium]
MKDEWRVERPALRTTRHSFIPTHLFLAIFCLGVWSGSTAQRIDSIPHYLHERRSPVVKLDMRGSFIGNQQVNFAGIKLGLSHAGVVQYGIGYSFLLSPVRGTAWIPGLGERTTRLRLGYVAPYFDFAFYKKGHWELRLPVQIGIGGGSVVYDGADGRTQKLEQSMVFIYEPCMTAQYRFLRYLAVAGGWGYRLTLRSAHLADGLTAPIYIFELRVFFGDIWRDVKHGS